MLQNPDVPNIPHQSVNCKSWCRKYKEAFIVTSEPGALFAHRHPGQEEEEEVSPEYEAAHMDLEILQRLENILAAEQIPVPLLQFFCLCSCDFCIVLLIVFLL